MEAGIVGLPNVGKSTLFNALVAAIKAQAANYPFCTIEPNEGIVAVPDNRLEQLAKLSGSEKIVPATVRFVDIAGLVAGASKGEGLGNKFLSHIREAHAIVHVVRCFESSDIIHVSGKVDPVNDINVILTEFCLADLQMLENALPRIEKQLKLKKELKPLVDVMQRLVKHLNEGRPVRSAVLTDEEMELLKPYPFLTQKPTIYLATFPKIPTLRLGPLLARVLVPFYDQGTERAQRPLLIYFFYHHLFRAKYLTVNALRREQEKNYRECGSSFRLACPRQRRQQNTLLAAFHPQLLQTRGLARGEDRSPKFRSGSA